MLARPPYIILIPIPERIDEALAELIGDITFSREERERAEKQLSRGGPLNWRRILWLRRSSSSASSLKIDATT